MRLRRLSAILLGICGAAQSSFGYSVLTHQQIIDLAWRDSIRPVLLSRYPHMTDSELRLAESYAYGGCAIQDAGYYPFGKEFFSELTHYVRTGDFVSALIRDARDADELAFALGALSHYVGDSYGHRDATNPSTAIEFPNLAAKYGPVVTYDESPRGHVRTEFAFDINQLSKRRFAPSAYLQHIGLRVPTRLVDQAFYETYGLDFNRIVHDHRAATQSYRWAVRTFVPDFAYAEVLLHRTSFPEDLPSPEFQEFQQRLADADFRNGWEQYRKKPGVRTHLLAFAIWILPKVGPISYLAIRGPNQETEQKYVASVNFTLDEYERLLSELAAQPQADPGRALHLDNRDLDTGNKVRPGGYPLTDSTYARLLDHLVKARAPVPDELRQNIEDYYADPNAPITTRKHKKAWRRVQAELVALQSMRGEPGRGEP